MAEIVRLALEVEARRLARDLNSLEQRLEQLGDAGDKSAKKVEGSFNRLEKKSKDLGRAIKAGFAILATGGIAKAAFDAAREVEVNFSRIEGLVGASREEIEQLEGALGGIAATTGRSERELSRALFTIKSAGADAATAIEVLQRAAEASAAGLGDTETVARALLGAIEAYGAANLDAAESLDIITAAVRAGNVNAAELAGTLGRVTGVAAELGVAFNDLNAFIATASLTGLNAAEATTKLGAALRFLNVPTDATIKGLESIGTSLDEVRTIAGSGPQGFLRAFQFLRQQLEQNGKTFGDLIKDSEGLSAALILAGKNAASAERIFGDLADATGASQQAFAAWQGTADAAATTAQARFGSALRNIGKSILPDVTFALNQLADTIDFLNRVFFDADFGERSALQQTNQSLSETIERIEELETGIDALESIPGANFFDFLTPGASIQDAKDELEELRKLRDDLRAQQLTLINSAQLRREQEEVNAFVDEVKTKLGEIYAPPPTTFQQFFGGVFNTIAEDAFESGTVVVQSQKNVRSEAQKLLDTLNEEKELFGDTTRLAQVRYDLEQGKIKGVTTELKTLIETRAAEIDQLEKDEERRRLIREANEQANEEAEQERQRRQQRAQELQLATLTEEQRQALLIADQLRELNALADEFPQILSPEDVQIAADDITSQFEGIRATGEETFNAMEEFSARTFAAMENTASDLFFSVMQGNLDGFADNFKSTIDRIAADVLASQLFDSQSGVFASLLGGGAAGAGATGGTAGAGASGGILAALASSIFAADGAFAKRGQPFIVGEEGPELFVPQTAGNIVPLKGPAEVNAGGGPSDDQFSTGTQQVTVNMTINTPDVASFQRSQGQIAANAAATFNTALKRNG